jgi:hypothetical protein
MKCPICSLDRKSFVTIESRTYCLECKEAYNKKKAHAEYVREWRKTRTEESRKTEAETKKKYYATMSEADKQAMNAAQYESRKARYTEEQWIKIRVSQRRWRAEQKAKKALAEVVIDK